MDDVRLVNYITLIKNINKAIGQGVAFEDKINEDMRYIIDTKSRRSFSATEDKTSRLFFSMFDAITERVSTLAFEVLGFRTPLTFIYDYGKCNIYARVIMDISKYSFDNLNSRNNAYLEIFDDSKKRIENASNFIQFCKNLGNFEDEDKYKFIFGALMILTVDKRDAEEHLSLICDYAKLLNITDDEFEDIILIVKNIYDLDDLDDSYYRQTPFGLLGGTNLFKSEKVPSIFSKLISLAKNTEVVIGVEVKRPKNIAEDSTIVGSVLDALVTSAESGHVDVPNYKMRMHAIVIYGIGHDSTMREEFRDDALSRIMSFIGWIISEVSEKKQKVIDAITSNDTEFAKLIALHQVFNSRNRLENLNDEG